MRYDQLFNKNCDFYPTNHPLCQDFYSNDISWDSDQNYLEPTNVRQVLDRSLKKISESNLPGKEHFCEYMRYKYRRNHKSNTLQATFVTLRLFLSFYQNTNKVHLELISRTDLEAFIEYEQDRGLKPASIRTRIGHLYAFIKYLVEQKIANHELLMYKIKVKQPNLLPRAIDPDDINSLLSVLDGIRDRAMILLLLRTGMRIGELLNTKVRDIDLREQKILIYQADKTDVGRVVYFCQDAMDALTAWLNTRDFSKELLFNGRGCNSICYETARTIFHKNLKKADLLGKGYTLHCLRHTFASELLNSGMRLECLQVLMGHRTIDVTRRYARLTDKTREKEYFAAMEIIQRGEIDGNYQLDN